MLTKVLAGTPNKLIARDLDIGLRTVELRRSNLMKKMGQSHSPNSFRWPWPWAVPRSSPRRLRPPRNSRAELCAARTFVWSRLPRAGDGQGGGPCVRRTFQRDFPASCPLSPGLDGERVG